MCECSSGWMAGFWGGGRVTGEDKGQRRVFSRVISFLQHMHSNSQARVDDDDDDDKLCSLPPVASANRCREKGE